MNNKTMTRKLVKQTHRDSQRKIWWYIQVIIVSIIVAFMLSITPASVNGQYIAFTRPVSQEFSNKRVLVLHSYHQGFTWTDNISRGIHAAFAEHANEIEIFFEFMDARRHYTDAYFKELQTLYRLKYSDVPIDVIIASDDQALNFMLGLGQEIFPDIPIVFCSVSGNIPTIREGYQITGLLEAIEIEETLDIALHLHPNTQEVAVITDFTQTGRALKAKAEAAFRAYEDRVRFRYLEHETVDELPSQLAALSPETIVFLFIFSSDKEGRVFSHEHRLKMIADDCPVPIYSVWAFYLGHGIMGGKLTSGEAEGRLAGSMALRILSGEKASDIPLERSPSQYMFDAAQLTRFNLKTTQLPDNSLVINQSFSFYQQYRGLIWGVSAAFVFLIGAVTVLIGNIVRRKRAEEELRKLAIGLEQRVTERTSELKRVNEELAAFSYSVSHDLRAPLRRISGFSQMLVEDYGSIIDENGQDYLRRLQSLSKHMTQLIEDLLNLSRVTRGELQYENVNLSDLAKEIIRGLQETQPGRELTLDISPNLSAFSDQRLMRVALENLLSNAWKFTRERPNAKISFGARLSDGETTYFVSDNGVGFDMTYADKLFKAFQRLHSDAEFEGTGIGLATVQRIIHRHGGRIWAEGQPEQGATFYFTLPQVTID